MISLRLLTRAVAPDIRVSVITVISDIHQPAALTGGTRHIRGTNIDALIGGTMCVAIGVDCAHDTAETIVECYCRYQPVIRIQRPVVGFSGDIRIANNAIYASRALRVPRSRKIGLTNNVGTGSSERPLDEGEWAPVGNRTSDLDKKLLPKPDSILLEKGAGAREPER